MIGKCTVLLRDLNIHQVQDKIQQDPLSLHIRILLRYLCMIKEYRQICENHRCETWMSKSELKQGNNHLRVLLNKQFQFLNKLKGSLLQKYHLSLKIQISMTTRPKFKGMILLCKYPIHLNLKNHYHRRKFRSQYLWINQSKWDLKLTSRLR